MVSPNFQNHLCGLCGNFNGDLTDEFTGSDGTLYSESDLFAESWRVGRKRPGCGLNELPFSAAGMYNNVVALWSDWNPSRRRRAEKDCALLKHSEYSQCAKIVSVQPYFQ